MAKKWHRLREVLARDLSIETDSDDPEVLFGLISPLFSEPVIINLGGGLMSVDGAEVNEYKFIYKMLLYIESSGEITPKTFRKSCQTVGMKLAKKRQQRRVKKIERDAGTDYASALVMANTISSVFYSSPKWRRLRYRALERYGNKCQACGRDPKHGVAIHVDHIKPRSLFPDLAFDFKNLQVLCEDCNLGKGASRGRDWR